MTLIDNGLSSSIFTRDVNMAFRAMRDARLASSRRVRWRRGASPVRRLEETGSATTRQATALDSLPVEVDLRRLQRPPAPRSTIRSSLIAAWQR
jgi:hypothetical protein